MNKVIFSICHTTARPEGWQESYRQWIETARHPENVEYILTVDERWGFMELPYEEFAAGRRAIDRAVWNTGRKCMVDGSNIAAANAFGKVLIINSDDMFPGDGWDEKLLAAIRQAGSEELPLGASIPDDIDGDFVIRTHPGDKYQAWLDHFVEEGRDPIISRLMTLQILSRARYQRSGYALYPEFESMMADTDFTDAAEQDGAVIEAHDILIEHRHPFVTGTEKDEVSKHENELAAHALGSRIYARRHAERVGGTVVSMPAKRKRVAALLPGDTFSWTVMNAWSSLLMHVAAKCDFAYAFESCSNQYFARDFAWQAMRRHIERSGQRPNYVLWLDSDNVLTPEGFDLLLDVLDQAAEISAVGGWYFMDVNPPEICARVRDNGKIRSVRFDELQAAYDELRLVRVTDHMGFGAILMRYEVMETAGEWPFMPIVETDPEAQNRPWPDAPYKGDDVSFCLRAIDRGFNFFLHPDVYLPHLKRKAIPGPTLAARKDSVADAAD